MFQTNATVTLGLAVGLGTTIWMLAQRLRVPALVPLMVVGVLLGKHSGIGLIDTAHLGDGLRALITLSVAILVFEGSLHLDQETLGHSPRAVRGLLTIGALVTWVGVAAAGVWILELPVRMAIVLGAILIVTGPTVIQPLLRRVRLTPRLHAALLSEGILIDPIGVIAAVATLEVVLVGVEGPAGGGAWAVVAAYAAPFVVGGSVGAAAGFIARWLLSRAAGFGHDGERNVAMIVLTTGLLAASASEMVVHESGIVAAAVAGVIVARTLKRQLTAARHAAESVAATLVGVLFILLASDFDIPALAAVGWREVAFVAVVMLLVRPLSVAAATVKSSLDMRERTYLALMAPRGIVAVSAVALVAAALEAKGSSVDSSALAALQQAVLLVVTVTVIWAGLVGSPLARVLGVRGQVGAGMLIAGASKVARQIALELKSEGVAVRLVDTNAAHCAAAANAGLDVFHGDATDFEWLAHDVWSPEFGWVLAATGNADVDRVVTRWGTSAQGEGRAAGLDGAARAPGASPPPGDSGEPGIGVLTDQTTPGQIIELVETGHLQVQRAGPSIALRRVLVSVKNGRVVSLGAPTDNNENGRQKPKPVEVAAPAAEPSGIVRIGLTERL